MILNVSGDVVDPSREVGEPFQFLSLPEVSEGRNAELIRIQKENASIRCLTSST